MASVTIIPQPRTEAAIDYMATQFARQLTPAQFALLKQAGSDLVGWSKIGKVVYRAEAQIKKAQAAAEAAASLAELEARTAA